MVHAESPVVGLVRARFLIVRKRLRALFSAAPVRSVND
ncbi:hypothetical protein K788_0003899 [Paraburkholderia caribensis MBA4]|uniref:Uncharacterized protein n=1 Tax=Paraburkholderia caribensis MBA4 TaxID=1323664 RepID=A0A0P0RAS8_9BURK|nr:hypothetical protein K788_0003899 [Paraburkholderia caribensis MBA4]